MQNCENDLKSAFTGLFMDINRNSSAIIDNGNNIAFSDNNGDIVAVASQRFVYGVIHNFINQVMQA